MNKPDWKGMAASVKMGVGKHSPAILMGIGITGMVGTVILAVKVTPKAVRLLEEKKEEEQTDKLGALDTVKTAWKCYIPAVITGTLSIICLVGSNNVNGRRLAALGTAYTLSESTLKKYRDKVIETIGEKKERGIQDELAKERIERNPVNMREVIITERGNTLCHDTISGRYFKCDKERIDRAVNEINKRMLTEMYISLSEFYFEIELEPTAISDDIGWCVDKGLLEISYTSALTRDGTPCLDINYDVAPKYDYC